MSTHVPAEDRGRGSRYWLPALAILAALLWLAGRGLPDGRLHVYFLDVGQGDAVFILAPDGRQILVDGGPSPAALLAELGDLMPFWDRTLDLVVLTHPDADHSAGLVGLLERYQPAQVLHTLASERLVEAQSWRQALAAAHVSGTVASRGMTLSVGALTGSVLNPDAASPLPGGDGNNGSIVLRLDYGQASFLLSGDAGLAAEAGMLAAGLPLRAGVLKVGHHGSSQSSSADFLAAVDPALAVIQVGSGNRFGHPHPDTLARLAGRRLLRTDLNGRVEVISDGQELWVRSAH